LIEVWDYATMALDLTNLPYQAQDLYMLHHKPVLSLTFSKDDKILASGDAEGLIRVWKFADGKKLRELDTQTIGVACLAFISSSSLVAGCLDKSVRIYGLKSGNLLKNLKGHDSFLLSVQPLSDNLLLSAAEDGGMLLWNVAEPTDCLVKRLKLPSLGKDVIFGNCEARGNEVLMCPRFKSCYLVDLDSNKVLMDYQSNQSKEEEMLYARFSPDGLYVYALASSRNLYVFDKRSGKLLNLISVPTAKPEVAGVETGPNGTMIVFDLGELFKLD
jgi:WD40 repeat-containing protein SMU1